MGNQLGEAQIPIRATLDRLDRDLNQARNKVTSALNAVGNAAGIALAGLAGLSAGAVAGLTKLIVPSTMAAARVSELSAVLDLLGERAGWSQQEIDDNAQAIKDLGIRTDVSLGLMAQFARYQLDAADATSLARVAQDAAVLSMQDSSDTLDQLMHGILTQNSMVLRNAGVNVMAGEAIAEYADALGKATSELTEAERIQAVMNAVMEEGERIAGAYETAMEEPGKALRSLSRHFYEAQVAIGEHFLPAMGFIVDTATDAAKGIRTLLEDGQPLSNLFESLGDLAMGALEGLERIGEALFGDADAATILQTALDPVINLIDDLTDGVTTASGIIAELTDNIQAGVDPVDAISEAIGTFVDYLFGASDTADTLHNVLDALKGIYKLVVEGDFTGEFGRLFNLSEDSPVVGFILDLRDAIGRLVEWIDDLVEMKDVLLALGITIASVVLPVLGSVLSAVLPVIAIFAGLVVAIAGLRKAWEEDFLGIRSYLTDLWENTIKPVFERVRDTFQEVWPDLIANLKDLWAELQPAFQDTSNFILDVLVPAIEDGLVLAIEGLGEGLIILVRFITYDLIPTLTEVVRWVKGDFIPWFNRARDTVSGWGQRVQEIVQNVRDAINNARDRITQAIQDVHDWFDRLLTPIRAVRDFIDRHISPILDALANVYLAAVSLEIRILTALWENVLLPALQKVGAWVQDHITPIFDAFATFIREKVNAAIEKGAAIWENKLQPALRSVANFIERTVSPKIDQLREKVGFLQNWVAWLKEHGIDPLWRSLAGIVDITKSVVDWLNNLADRMRNLKLPEWLEPGSPTPFELGLRGISDALDELSRIRLPALSAGLELSPALVGAMGGERTLETINNYNLIVNTSAPHEDVIADFNMMKVLAGA